MEKENKEKSTNEEVKRIAKVFAELLYYYWFDNKKRNKHN